jgi:Rrf2 family protein
MRLSRAAGYALHALAYLAQQKANIPVSTKIIAGEIGIPDIFLLKSLKPLVARQVLDSITGPRGGYRLARPADDISVLEVVEAVDGPVPSGSSYRSPGHSPVDKVLDSLTEESARRTREVFSSASISQLSGRKKASMTA